ncbi:uncharacterized protein LOC62_02G001836 [Vanrija pseudolonga]|uniref:Uncharacterized protein n=1 Tax=Vanrija pseudolonga TaxID=143232 RepID=A0AAF0Y5Y2_9TREE|nr:hypothetical protein LOC62_02G001836 [Vanrija pseudolonga]
MNKTDCDFPATAPANAIVLHPPPPPTASITAPATNAATDSATGDTDAAARVAADCPWAWTYLSTHICDAATTAPSTGVTGVYGPPITTTKNAAPSSAPAHGTAPRSAGDKVHAAVSVVLVVLVIHVLVALYQ